MGHPNLSDRLNSICESQLMYKDMRLGEILQISALDAASHTPGVFSVQVVHLKTHADGHISAVYRFLDEDFSFFGDDRQTPAKPRKGELAGAGISAIHIPQFVFNMLGFGGIGLGRDYAFEFVGGRGEFMYAARIKDILRLPPPFRWREPKTAVARWSRKTDRIKAEADKRRAQHQTMLRRALVVKTANSTYHLTAVDDEGVRELRKEGENAAYKAKLHGANVGGCMIADIEIEPRTWRPLQTSTVVSIEAMD